MILYKRLGCLFLVNTSELWFILIYLRFNLIYLIIYKLDVGFGRIIIKKRNVEDGKLGFHGFSSFSYLSVFFFNRHRYFSLIIFTLNIL